MKEALENIHSKVVVLQSFTRELASMEVVDMNQRIDDLVNLALTKTEKVVISTIINRTDITDIDLKVAEVNLHIERKYRNHESVVICDNHKLHDKEFRGRDELHLNNDGVPIFASNLKFSIAEALGVRVIKKQRYNEERYDRRFDDRYENNYRRSHREDNRQSSRWY